ncbi:transcriptional regulator HxlR family [Vibrio astriarenae]|nr:transcriptional regulator HxlR family [Vibrio sp. C7]
MESTITVDNKGRKSVANVCKEPCAIEKGMRLIGGKWKGSLIYHLKMDQSASTTSLECLVAPVKNGRPKTEGA